MAGNKVDVISESTAARVSKSRSHRGPEQRKAEVLASAGRLFLELGFSGVSLEMIIAATGGSYRDFYAAFGSKEALFQEVLKRLCDDFLAPLRATFAEPEFKDKSLAEALTDLGSSLLQTLLTPDALAFHRLMVSEAPRVPEIAGKFFRSGPEEAGLQIARFLKERSKREELILRDPKEAATIFLDGLTNNLQLKALTGGQVSGTEISKRVREVVRLFLHGACKNKGGRRSVASKILRA